MNASLRSAIRDELLKRSSLEELIAVLIEHKTRGVSRDEAYTVLEELRADADDATDDRILELMDTVSGFCAPEHRLWDSTAPKAPTAGRR